MIEGKAKEVLEWARKWPEIDGYLKLNALVSQDGDASLNVIQTDSTVKKFIDGTAIREYLFQLKIVTAWSDGFNPVNVEAERLAASWIDWVNRQYPDNVPDFGDAEITDISAIQNAPALNMVYQDDGLAEYAIQAKITYRE